MGRDVLGEFEHQVLLALLRLGDDAYSAPVVVELEKQARRPITSAAVYIALRHLEEKGLVTSEMHSPGAEGGRDRRHFSVTNEGRVRLQDARATFLRLWRGLGGVLEGEA